MDRRALLFLKDADAIAVDIKRRAGSGLDCRFHFLDEQRSARARFQARELEVAAPNGQPRQEELKLDQRLFQGGCPSFEAIGAIDPSHAARPASDTIG